MSIWRVRRLNGYLGAFCDDGNRSLIRGRIRPRLLIGDGVVRPSSWIVDKASPVSKLGRALGGLLYGVLCDLEMVLSCFLPYNVEFYPVGRPTTYEAV